MTLSKIQPFLEEAFEFLCDREFSVSSEDWTKFCASQGMSLEKLKSAKSELLRQSQKLDDDSERLKQIFCCDPFDASNTKALRDIWHNKAEYQPDPFQRWFSDISIHLLDLGSVSSPNPISPAPSPTIASYTKPISTTSNPANVTPKLSKEVLSAVITGSIIGVFVMVAMIINNAGKQTQTQTQTPVQTPSPQQTPTPVQTPPPQQTAPTPTPIQTPSPQQTAPTPTPIQIPSPQQTPTPIQTPSPQQTPTPVQTPSPRANARIGGKQSGAKNLRSGPGTDYGIIAKINTGEDIEILDKSQDSGGYVWYQVRHQQSGTKGWIAAQLVNIK